MRRLVCDLTFISLIAFGAVGCGANSDINNLRNNTKPTIEDGGGAGNDKPGDRDEGEDESDASATDGGGQTSDDNPGTRTDGGSVDSDDVASETDDTTPVGSTMEPETDSSVSPLPDDPDFTDDSDESDTEIEPTDDTEDGLGGAGNVPDDSEVTDDTDDTDDGTDPTGTDVTDPFEDCSPSIEGDSSYCYGSLNCDDQKTYANADCYDNGSNAECWCSASRPDGTSTSLSLLVEDFQGRETCEVLMDTCLQNEQPTFEGEFTCTNSSQSQDEGYCNRTQTCTREAVLPGGLVVQERGSRDINCGQGDDSDIVNCSCYEYLGNYSTYRNEYFGGVTVSEGCGFAEDVCWNGIEPQVSGEKSCSDYAPGLQSSSTYCSDAIQCSQSAIIDGETIQVSEITNLNCSKTNSSSWECYCNLNNESASFDTPNGATPEATCGSAVDTCDEVLAVEMTSDLTCEIISHQTSGEYYCSTQVECSKSGQLGDVTVRRSGGVNVGCDQNGEGGWYCSCYSNNTGESATVTPAAGLDISDTCLDAAGQCVNSVDLSIGVTNSGFGPRPGGPIVGIAQPDVDFARASDSSK